MTAHPYLRTRDLALTGHISVQQVRNYEASGLIPKAQRSQSGYRLYTQQHLAALKTVKSMVHGYGWQRPCISGNSRVFCTRFANRTAATASMTSNRCAAYGGQERKKNFRGTPPNPRQGRSPWTPLPKSLPV